VREQFRAAGLEHEFGPIRENATIASLVQQWQEAAASTSNTTKVPFQLA